MVCILCSQSNLRPINPGIIPTGNTHLRYTCIFREILCHALPPPITAVFPLPSTCKPFHRRGKYILPGLSYEISTRQALHAYAFFTIRARRSLCECLGIDYFCSFHMSASLNCPLPDIADAPIESFAILKTRAICATLHAVRELDVFVLRAIYYYSVFHIIQL